MLPGEEDGNAAHRNVRVRVEQVIGRMKNYRILRDSRPYGDGLYHAVQAVAHMHHRSRIMTREPRSLALTCPNVALPDTLQ
ncbi:hypothetical protein GCM10010289_58030 [Streptomyces violascens]|nr:hypothetical protein GCM10010289_58030 [Streptomyces violascens]